MIFSLYSQFCLKNNTIGLGWSATGNIIRINLLRLAQSNNGAVAKLYSLSHEGCCIVRHLQRLSSRERLKGFFLYRDVLVKIFIKYNTPLCWCWALVQIGRAHPPVQRSRHNGRQLWSLVFLRQSRPPIPAQGTYLGWESWRRLKKVNLKENLMLCCEMCLSVKCSTVQCLVKILMTQHFKASLLRCKFC